MKKKFLLLGMAVMMVFALAACGAPKDERTLDTFKTAFEKGGIVLEMEDVPFFQMIGAEDGIIFYNKTKPVKVYQFADETALEKAVKENSILANMPKNGKFVLDTNDEQATEIFNNVAK